MNRGPALNKVWEKPLVVLLRLCLLLLKKKQPAKMLLLLLLLHKLLFQLLLLLLRPEKLLLVSSFLLLLDLQQPLLHGQVHNLTFFLLLCQLVNFNPPVGKPDKMLQFIIVPT